MKVFPDELGPRVQSTGEKQIHRALKEANGRDDWRVLYSLDIRNGVDGFETEADFVVLAPNLGILFVEVKACKTLSFDGNVWMLGQKSETRGPYKQARNAMYAVKNFLKLNGINVRSIPFYSAVWFTELSRNEFPAQIEREDAETLSFEDLRGDIGQVLERAMSQLSSPVGNLKDGFTSRVCDKVHKLLRPRFEIGTAPLRQEELIDSFAQQALDEQLSVFDAYREQKKMLVDSLAGTGKTFVALQAAKEAAANGDRVLFVCHNRFLADFIRAELAAFLNVNVATVKGLMTDYSNLEIPSSPGDDWWNIALPESAIAATTSLKDGDRFDSLIIDEAQDVGSVPNLVFLDGLIEGGLERAERLFFAGDFSHQDLFLDGQDAKKNLIEMSGSSTVVVNSAFGKNCRNTHRVGTQLKHWVNLDPSWSGYRRSDDSGRPNIRKSITDAEILKAFDDQLTIALKSYPLESIVVLTRHREKVAEVLARKGLGSVSAERSRAKHVRVGSPFDFKGLESKCVLFVELNGRNDSFLDQLYVAGTRTTGDLFVAVDASKMELDKGR